RLADSGREEFVPATVLLEMRERLPRLDGDGSYARWARWFFSDRSTRTLSPRSPITVPDYARRCVEEATPRGLAEALRLFPTNHPARLAGSPRDDQAGLSRIPLTAPRFPGRDPRCSINCLDLSPYYNAALREEWHQPTNASTGWSLRGLPAGRWRLGGVEFDVRGLIQLAGQGIQAQRPPYPVGVTNLVVGRACAGLHFLHASIWAIPLPSGTRIGRYIVRYVDGRTHDIPIVHRQNSLEWQGHEEQVRGLKDTVLAWRGRMPNGKPCRLLRYGWSNPRPSVPIHSLDFVSEMTLAGPFLVAITLDESQPKVTRREFPSRNPDCPTNCLDLSASYTSLLTEDWHGDRWAGNNLAVLPAGTHKLAGVEFDVRGIIQMSGLEIEKHAPGFPEVVEGIPVHQKVRRIHFLHAVAWGNHVASGTVIGQYELAYRGGGLATVPLRTGQELAEWKTGGTFPHLPLARVAWTGTNAWRSPIQLFKYSWENPRPDAVIETLAIRSQKTAAALFLVAATTE
ncbi:MAG TPA: hypothetical protein VNO52_01635, partial [Methylomirabilota bacterium]|nr:hypothetical protein [Methylomirabilota bacterium]